MRRKSCNAGFIDLELSDENNNIWFSTRGAKPIKQMKNTLQLIDLKLGINLSEVFNDKKQRESKKKMP